MSHMTRDITVKKEQYYSVYIPDILCEAGEIVGYIPIKET